MMSKTYSENGEFVLVLKFFIRLEVPDARKSYPLASDWFINNRIEGAHDMAYRVCAEPRNYPFI